MHDPFDHILEDVKKRTGKKEDTDLNEAELDEIVSRSKEAIQKATGKPFPTEARDQLTLAINAVFDSWMNNRAIEYRKLYRIPDDWGTAVNVQTMVYGNLGDDCEQAFASPVTVNW